MKNIIAVLFIIILVASCEKDITVNIPPQPVKLVVNGITSANTAFRVTVSKTTGILDLTTPDSYKVTNAFVQLYVNNVLTDTLVYNTASNAYIVKRNTLAQTGNTYLLKADAAGFTTAEAQTVTPANISIQNITRRPNARTDANGNSLDEVKISFTDDGANTNYYLLKFRRPYYNGAGSINYQGIDCIHSSDKDIERRNNTDPTDFANCIDREFFMTDKNFNGRVKEIVLFMESYALQPVLNPTNNRFYRATIELNSITADHYKYRKSYDAYRDSEDNPFAEPVLVFTNVKNGYGVFSSYTLARDTIR